MPREIKDSGIGWVGAIPENWEILPQKYLMKKQKTICEHWANENVMSLTMSGVIIRDLVNPKGKMPATFDGYQYVEPGNLLLCLFDIDVTPRCVGLVNNNGVTSPAYSRFYMLPGAHARYYEYYLIAIDNQKSYLHLTKNLRFSLNEEEFGAIWAVRPPESEQDAIADYLDRKCIEIDRAIASAERSIDEYQAYKKSLIFRVVTKGLDPDVSMKDSGIEWIGDMPQGWELRQAGQLATQTKNANVGMAETNLLSLSYGTVKRRDINAKGGLLPESFEGYNIIEEGDIVLRFTDLQNDQKSLRVGRCTERGIITSAYVSIRPIETSISKFLYYALHSYDLRKGFYGMGAGVRQGLKWQEAKYIALPFPDAKQRESIVKYLDNKCVEVDAMIEAKQDIIEELKAYKKSLIFEAVTGKRKLS